MFNFVDYSIIVFYCVCVLLLGLFLKRRAQQKIEEYFLAGKSMPAWMLGIAGMTNHLDMTGTMFLVSLMFLIGPRMLLIEIRGGLGLIVAFAMVYMGKWNRRSGCMTAAEWMAFRFGNGMGGNSARMVQAISRILFTVGMLAYFVKGAGLFLSMFLPFSPFVCALLIVGITTIYTVSSGFYGVVYNDLLQTLVILAAVMIVVILAIMAVPSHSELIRVAQEVTKNPDWANVSVPLHAQMPSGYELFNDFFMAIMFYLALTIFNGMSMSGSSTTYFAAKNERDCGILTFIWITLSSIRWPLIAGFTVLGIFLIPELFPTLTDITQTAQIIKNEIPGIEEYKWSEVVSSISQTPTNYPEHLITQLKAILGDDWRSKILLVNYKGMINAEQVLPAVIYYVIPPGLKGIIFVALLAAAMSTFAPSVNMAASYFVRDIYQPFIRSKAQESELVKVSCLASVIVVAIGFLLGYYAKSINDIWTWICTGLLAGLAIPGLLRWYWWRLNGIGFSVGTLSGLVAAFFQRWFFPELNSLAQFIVMISVSFMSTICATYLSSPTSREVLKNFYIKTKPFGFWGAFKSELSGEQQRAITDEHKADIKSLFIAVPWQFFLYAMIVEAMLFSMKPFLVCLVCFVICSVGLYFWWYRKLPVDKVDKECLEKPTVSSEEIVAVKR